MRKKQFTAILILAMYVLLLCTACQRVENTIKDTTEVSLAAENGSEEETVEENQEVSTDTVVSTGEVKETLPENETQESTEAREDVEPFDAEVEGVSFKDVLAVHRADLDHDGADEAVVVHLVNQNRVGAAKRTAAVSVVRDGSILWEDAAVWVRDYGLEAYFLYTADDGKTYLVYYEQYRTNFYETRYRYFSLNSAVQTENGFLETETWAIQSLRAHWEGNAYQLDVNTVLDYVNGLNAVLEKSIALCSNYDKKIQYTTADEPLTYREELNVLFEGQVDYSGCETIEEKLAALNKILSPVEEKRAHYWEEAEDLFERLLEENADENGNIPTAETLDKSKWFADYNGDKLQVISSDVYSGCCIDAFTGTIFYRADEGETPAEAARLMVEAVAEEMMVPSENRWFTITKYLILEPDLRQYAYMGKDIWYFYADGYFRYNGDGGIIGSFETYAEYADTMVDGMLPFYYQGADGAAMFMLMRDGDVYRLQKAWYWGK